MSDYIKKKDKLIFLSLVIYFFIIVYGNVFKFSQQEASIGFSTVLILIIIIPKILTVRQVVFKQPLFFLISVLLLWCSMSALFTQGEIVSAYIRLAMMIGYLFAAASVYQMQLTNERVKLLIYTLSISILVASLLTIIDFLKIYNIPYVNETSLATKIAGAEVEQAGGFFPRRSAMAAYYSIIIPTLIYYAMKIENIREKTFMFLSSGVSILALFLTHNRSGILSILLAVSIFLFFDKTIKASKKMGIVLYMPIVLGGLLYVAFVLFPEHLDVYILKLNRYLPGGIVESAGQVNNEFARSDESRIYFFISVMESLLTNPIGNGFSLVYTERYGFNSPHNIITYIIWSAGLMAFVWLPLFARQVYRCFSLKELQKKLDEKQDLIVFSVAFQVGLLSWFLNNMTHNSLNTGLAWLYLGVVLNVINTLKNASNNKPKSDEIIEIESPTLKTYVGLK